MRDAGGMVRAGDVLQPGAVGRAKAVVVLVVVAGLLLPVLPCGLGPGAHWAVRSAAVAQTAGEERAR